MQHVLINGSSATLPAALVVGAEVSDSSAISVLEALVRQKSMSDTPPRSTVSRLKGFKIRLEYM